MVTLELRVKLATQEGGGNTAEVCGGAGDGNICHFYLSSVELVVQQG